MRSNTAAMSKPGMTRIKSDSENPQRNRRTPPGPKVGSRRQNHIHADPTCQEPARRNRMGLQHLSLFRFIRNANRFLNSQTAFIQAASDDRSDQSRMLCRDVRKPGNVLPIGHASRCNHREAQPGQFRAYRQSSLHRLPASFRRWRCSCRSALQSEALHTVVPDRVQTSRRHPASLQSRPCCLVHRSRERCGSGTHSPKQRTTPDLFRAAVPTMTRSTPTSSSICRILSVLRTPPSHPDRGYPLPEPFSG